jgi:uncharacterized protein YecT (DUF1311 family)
MKKIPVVLLISLPLFFITFACSGKSGAKELDCKNAVIQIDINECAYREYQSADKELSAVYKKLVTAVEKSDAKKAKGKLIEAHKAWITFRDRECVFSSVLYEGGTMYSSVYDGCLTGLTKKRTDELKEHIKALE